MTINALDAMALAWAAVIFLGLWLIWPALAIVVGGVIGLATIIGLYLGKRRDVSGGGE